MNKLMKGVERFLREEEGTEVVEWALVGGLIVAVGATIFATIGDKVGIYLNNLDGALGTPVAN
ncbi:Flp family type IVb pilin [Litchfieldella rifensis]|uniref:Flp family type IVb pilin n=1 Tax=Litchfieldella rifensis TaxID=762643 RepID=A0ABV7LLJ1_9GAMM